MDRRIPIEQWEREQRPNAYSSLNSLNIIDPTDWQDRPIPARRWIVKDWIPHGAVTMVAGDGGVGKSLLMLQLLAATSLGNPFLGEETMGCRALGVFCEDEHEELQRRMDEVLKAEHAAFSDLIDLRLVSRVGMANEFLLRDKYGKARGPTPFYEEVLREAKEGNFNLVVLDGLHDLFDGNENSRPEARSFVNLLLRIALEIDGAVVLCAHPSMSGLASGTGQSGSTAWNNAVRSRAYLTRPKSQNGEETDEENIRELRNMKANYGARGGVIRLEWKDGVFERVQAPPSGTPLGTIGKLELAAAIMQACAELLANGTGMAADKRAGNYISKLLKKEALTRRFDFGAIEAAKERLIEDGELVRVTIFRHRKAVIFLRPVNAKYPEETL